ncbi:MAG: TolC family protein [Pirellulaceae bacterium]
MSEAIHLAVCNSQVIRDLGGQVLQSPEAVNTIQSPAIQETDPRFGIEAALSEFDANWSTQMYFEKNDRALNNILFGGGTRLFQQDLATLRNQLSKRSATGTLMSARHNIEYDFNNATGNDTPNRPWTANYELEMRHPLLQGGGTRFNRIAGPNAVPGFYNGVLIARLNADVSVLEFETSIRDLVSQVETAYWELYFAYRSFDATLAARDRALATWRQVESWRQSGLRSGTPQRETQAREQYFRLESELQNALAGRQTGSTPSQLFRGLGGVYTSERDLRALMGVPINDGRLILPVTAPTAAHIVFDWEQSHAEATTRRMEIQRQMLCIRRHELEITAAKNFLLPQLDVIGRYRWRGLGHNLLDSGDNLPQFDNAYQDLFDGNFQEWQLGLELTKPIGFRRAHAAVRHANLQLHRERAILSEQQRRITLELSNAVAEKDRAYKLSQITLNRRIAAAEHLRATEVLHDEADENQKAFLLDQLLEAQRRLADADIAFVRSTVDYMISIKQIHAAKGTLLDYNQVNLTEGPWPSAAYELAADRNARTIRH